MIDTPMADVKPASETKPEAFRFGESEFGGHDVWTDDVEPAPAPFIMGVSVMGGPDVLVSESLSVVTLDVPELDGPDVLGGDSYQEGK
jgi:hypothetical protein